MPGVTARFRSVLGAGVLPALAAALFLVPAGAQAQSLLSAYSFGTPMEALGARDLALGGIGVGLPGTSLAPNDPTSGADLALPAVVFTTQNTWNSSTEAQGVSSSTAARFPIIGVQYPVRGIGTFSLSLSSVLDQTWNVSREELITLDGAATQARVTDDFVSEGGISTLRVGISRRLLPYLTVGATVGSYIGNVNRSLLRSFDSLEVETAVPPFEQRGEWGYSGAIASFGATADIPGVARFSGAVALGGTLDAKPSDATNGEPFSLSMPTEYRFGATALLSSELYLTGGLVYADWTDTSQGLLSSSAGSALRVGGGIEWGGASILGKRSDLRLGYRRSDLPFFASGASGGTESVLSSGVSLNLFETGGATLARADLALERGNRESGSVSEDFWRFSATVRVSGF